MSDMPLTLEALAPRSLWVAWQTEDRPDGKRTKVPYSPAGKKARADAPDTWGTRPQAEQRALALPKPYGTGGVGIEFTTLDDGRNLAGIDLDACRVPETGTLECWAEDVLASFDSYAEVSPSGTGAKLFFTYPGDALPAFGRTWAPRSSGECSSSLARIIRRRSSCTSGTATSRSQTTFWTAHGQTFGTSSPQGSFACCSTMGGLRRGR